VAFPQRGETAFTRTQLERGDARAEDAQCELAKRRTHDRSHLLVAAVALDVDLAIEARVTELHLTVHTEAFAQAVEASLAAKNQLDWRVERGPPGSVGALSRRGDVEIDRPPQRTDIVGHARHAEAHRTSRERQRVRVRLSVPGEACFAERAPDELAILHVESLREERRSTNRDFDALRVRVGAEACRYRFACASSSARAA
jgi:hypothetical protein